MHLKLFFCVKRYKGQRINEKEVVCDGKKVIYTIKQDNYIDRICERCWLTKSCFSKVSLDRYRPIFNFNYKIFYIAPTGSHGHSIKLSFWNKGKTISHYSLGWMKKCALTVEKTLTRPHRRQTGLLNCAKEHSLYIHQIYCMPAYQAFWRTIQWRTLRSTGVFASLLIRHLSFRKRLSLIFFPLAEQNL